MSRRTVLGARFSRVNGPAFHPEPPSLARDAIALSTSQGIGSVCGFAAALISARFLGPDGYGMAALVISYPALLWTICSVKPMMAATRYLSEAATLGRWDAFRAVCRISYVIDLSSALVVVLIVQVTAEMVTGFYATSDLARPMLFYAVSFMFSSLNGTCLAILSAFKKFQWTGAFYALDALLTLLSISGLLWAGMGVAGVVLGTGIGHAVSALALRLAVAKAVKFGDAGSRSSSGEALPTVRAQLMKSLSWNYFAVTASGLAGQVPLWLLGQFRDVSDVGFYRLATTLVTVAGHLEASLSRVALPALTAVSAGSVRTVVDLRRWTTREGVAAASLVVAMVPLMAFAVPRMFGDRYEPMVFGLQLMLLGAAVSTAFFWVVAYYWAEGRVAQYSRTAITYNILGVVAGVPCAAAWGFLGLAAVNGLGRIGLTLTLVRLSAARHREVKG